MTELTQSPTQHGTHNHTTENLYSILQGAEGTWLITQEPTITYLTLAYPDHHINLYPDGTTETIYDLTYPDGTLYKHNGTTASEKLWHDYIDNHPEYLEQR